MSGIRLFYASTTGATRRIAEMVAKELGGDDLRAEQIIYAEPDDFLEASGLVLGISTWEEGAPHPDWEDFIEKLEGVCLRGKTVALFGLGDQKGYSGEFLGGMGVLYDRLVACRARIIGSWPLEGYDFERSGAVRDGCFVGLAIDEENQADLSEERVRSWVASIRSEMAK